MSLGKKSSLALESYVAWAYSVPVLRIEVRQTNGNHGSGCRDVGIHRTVFVYLYVRSQGAKCVDALLANDIAEQGTREKVLFRIDTIQSFLKTAESGR